MSTTASFAFVKCKEESGRLWRTAEMIKRKALFSSLHRKRRKGHYRQSNRNQSPSQSHWGITIATHFTGWSGPHQPLFCQDLFTYTDKKILLKLYFLASFTWRRVDARWWTFNVTIDPQIQSRVRYHTGTQTHSRKWVNNSKAASQNQLIGARDEHVGVNKSACLCQCL